MKILVVLPSINLITGGPAKSSLLRARELAARGHHVELFSTLWPNLEAPAKDAKRQDGYLIRLFPATGIPGFGHVPYSPSLLRELSRSARTFDIVLAGSLWNPLISRAMAIFRRQKIPYVITPHGMMDPLVFSRHKLLKSCWAWLFEKRNVETADLIIFTSEREETKARLKCWKFRRTIVLPNIVDLDPLQDLPPRHQLEMKYGQLRGRDVVAFVGRINWVKNLDILLKAIALLRERGRNVVLLCAGPDSDDYKAYLESLAETLGIQDSVVFTGLLEGNELNAVFARADVVALVSQKENFGRSAAEALAAGVPIVLSDGVDLGKDWPTPPVWRVEQSEGSIANGLDGALDYVRNSDDATLEARNLAQREWGDAHSDQLVASFSSIISRAS